MIAKKPVPPSDRRFYIRTSTIPGAGKGLFARTPMVAGERFQVQGVLVRKHSLADRCTAYADAYKFRVGNDLLIPLGYGGLVNHSLSPNLEKVVEGKKVYLQALRPINVGEELFFCYSRYAQRRFYLTGRKR
jgi:SET domain-containing protein